MPKKYTKADVENWSVEEVKSWLHSKKLTQCLPDFDCVSGYQLLGMTNDDLKALPSVAGSEKKRKALKKAVGQLPGNSISAKTVKSKGKPAKDPPPVENFPPASFEPVPAPPPLPPPSSFHHPPHSPNSATYSDPSLIWGDEDQPQDIYDNAADAREEMLAPPLPPHPGYHQQQVGGGQDGGYGQDDDQMIYDQYEEGEEEEMFDSSFASEEEEEEEEEEPSALNGLRNANQGTEANIRAIRAKFFAEGLRAHTGILTGSIPLSGHQVPVPDPAEEEGSDDDIYDLPPEELKQHPPHHPVVQPPDLPPPPHHQDEEEDEGEDIYDVAEEVLKSTGITMVKAPPPLPQPQAPPTEEIYETAAPDEEEETPPLPPFPPSFRDTDPTPPRPPKPASSPALPRKTPALGSPRPPMRGPIRGGPLPNIPALRPPIQSTPGPRPPLPPPVESESGGVGAATPPPPPPPPPLSPQTSNPGGSSSPRPWAQKKAPPPASSSSPFAGGRKFPAPSSRRSPSPPRTSENKFPRPLEMKGSGVPVPGKFLGRSALRPVGTKTDGEPKPVVSDKPMSIQERIKLLKKPGGEGGEGRKGQPPPKPAEGVSPCTRRKMSKDSSVSDLIKSYHSGGSSTDGEKSRPMSPETKPALPVKPPALSPKHGERSPQPKRHPTTQQIPPGLPEKRSGQPPWKKTASEEQEEQEPPKKTRQTVSKEEGQRPWQRRTSAEEATEHRPPWRKTGGEETVDVRPPWRKTGGEETVDVRPPWRKTGGEETADVRPPWRKNEEVSESRPPWRKPSVEEESQPSWKRPAAESPPQEGVVRSSFTHQESVLSGPFRASKSPAKPDLPPPRRTDNASPPDLPPPRRTDNASHPDLPPPRRTDNASPPDLPPPRRTDNASPPDLPPPRRTDNASPPDLPPPRHKEIAPPPPEPPRASDKLKSRFPAPDNAPSEPPGRGKSDKALPTEPPRPPLPVERSRFRAPDGPAPSVPKPSVVQEDAPPEVPKMTFLTNNRLRGRVLPTQEEEMPRLPPRPRKLPDRPLPTHGSEPGPGLPQRPWQRPPIAEPMDLPPRPPKVSLFETNLSHTVEPGPSSSSGSPLGHSWYHANLKDRKVAEARLFKHPRDGTFIIRDSSRTAGEYSLSLLYHGAVKHLRIRLRGDGQYVLGEEKADEVPFASVVELVNYHKEEPLVLKSGGNVMLRYECPH